MMLGIYQRMAELWTFSNARDLTAKESEELLHCLSVNASYVRKMSELNNLSYFAYETQDWDWLHEICGQLEQMEDAYNIKRKGWMNHNIG